MKPVFNYFQLLKPQFFTVFVMGYFKTSTKTVFPFFPLIPYIKPLVRIVSLAMKIRVGTTCLRVVLQSIFRSCCMHNSCN